MFPTGTVTLLFTDIEGSTQLLHRLGDGYANILKAHRDILRAAFAAHNGHEVDTQGDSFFAVFARAHDAIHAVAQAQRALHEFAWPEDNTVRVRMSLHTGEPSLTENAGAASYIGLDVHRGARLMAAAHGGQVLLSSTTRDLVEELLPSGLSLLDLGEHRLKDLARPVAITQLQIEGLPQKFPALRTLDTHPHNLPQQPTVILGREKEIEAACTQLRRDEVRLLTLSGPGGTGKTRLALQIAAELLHEYPAGAFFVDLAPLSDAAPFLSTLAQTLGVRETPGAPLLQSLTEHLKGGPTLLLFDNFEHVLEAAPHVAQLLAQCPKLKVLVTSRTVLRLRGEHELAVSPLALPVRKPWPPLSQLSQYAAVQLFIQRAQAAKSSFEVNAENAPAIAEICTRLDGLPLAIELAAARVKMLSPNALLARLEKSLNLLTGGARDSAARQQTLRAAIAWSHDFLDETERALFRRLSVFAGGATLDAIEAVCNASESDRVSAIDGDVFDAVCSLCDKSLLRQREDENGEPRFGMLETIREFGGEQLESAGEGEEIRRAHAQWFAAQLEEAEPHFNKPERTQWLQRLAPESDNVRTALAWSFEHDATLTLQLARFAYLPGLFTYAEEWDVIERALTVDDSALPVVRARMLGYASSTANERNKLDVCEQWNEQRAELERAMGNERELAWTVYQQGWNATIEGMTTRKFASARICFEQCLETFRRLSDGVGIGHTLDALGAVTQWEGNLVAARALFEEGLVWLRKASDVEKLGVTLLRLADVARQQSDFKAAHHFMQEVWEYDKDLRRRPHERGYLFNASGLIYLGEGDFAGAQAAFRTGIQIFADAGVFGNMGVENEIFYGLACAVGGQNQWARCIQILSAINHLCEINNYSSTVQLQGEIATAVAACRAALDDESYARAEREGRAMSMEQLVEYALQPD